MKKPSSILHSQSSPLRIVTAVPICDGHDSPIMTINLELARHGVEVIYLGYHRSARDMARAAVQEDARAIGISSYNGGHVEFFGEVRGLLNGAGIGLFGGGGGTITPEDAQLMKRQGVDEIFFAGTPLDEMVRWVRRRYEDGGWRMEDGKERPSPPPSSDFGAASPPSSDPTVRGGLSDLELARLLTKAELGVRTSARSARPSHLASSLVIGFTGAGGAGKTTLIDELVLRFLKARPMGRLAILSHDPSLRGQGALLGDRASMVYAQHDRVFMRSLATRGHAGGLSAATHRCLEILRGSGFDLILVESAGIGQEDVPFGIPSRNRKGSGTLVDKQVLVMSPEYGGRLQLQKLLMLETADIVAINKSDLPAARTAIAEIEQRLTLNRKGQKLIATVAKQHGDGGVDELFERIVCGQESVARSQ